MDFNKPYDLILGNDFIFKNVKTIIVENKDMALRNGVKLPFHTKIMQEQVYSLEESDVSNSTI